ncbi:MAG: DUF1638 domain-containing protein [Spirochaetales bacterium]|nr:MAG: DUF1638 domain-containing protein [Spirochaetales bacterium]
MNNRQHIYIIACGVLRYDIPPAAEKAGVQITAEYLPGGLHASPAELRKRLQESVDRVSAEGAAGGNNYSRIALGYGLCGRGTVDLKARGIPLAVPRVHDCISLFLGSDAAYRKEFSDAPGTYYFSAGWYEEQVQPKQAGQERITSKEDEIYRLKRGELTEKYGEKNADAILTFLDSWKQNYSRAAFIDTGSGEPEKYADHARAMAQEFGWKYKRIEGTQDILEKLLKAGESTDDILLVPPDYVTAYNTLSKRLEAYPVSGAAKQPLRKQGGSPAGNGGISGGQQRRQRIGLGIDAGGTYTDAVIHDFSSREILSKGKALTTKWDFTLGISAAVDMLSPELLPKVELAAVSTTLATNAIVEGQGQKVGLLLMPANLEQGSIVDLDQLQADTVSVISGRMTITGMETEPIDPEQVKREARRLLDREGVSVFAVSGYAGAVNPAHELEVKKILMEETGLSVCCGHELSDLLNFYVRANTAVLNARIIPLLEKFLEDVEKALASRHVTAPVMVVKGDGTLITGALARERPIETILSGPAASIAGARFLTGIEDATVVDVGGTTSDIGCLRRGRVEVTTQGAKVGGWRTHVKALDLSTLGLGGDSAILFEEQDLSIGPRRIAPLCWLGANYDLERQFGYISDNRDYFMSTMKPIQFFVLTGKKPAGSPAEEEASILRVLEDGPCSLLELAERSGRSHWMMLMTGRLEEEYIVQRCGLTPTDILHVLGEVSLWNGEASKFMAEIYARRMKLGLDDFCRLVMKRITDRLIEELIKKQLNLETGLDESDDCPSCRILFDALLTQQDERFHIKATFKKPIIGLGAPVEFFLLPAKEKVDAEVIIPEHAAVANAVGAITSVVHVDRMVHIIPDNNGDYVVHGLRELRRFKRFEEASEFAEGALRDELLKLAREAGTSSDDAQFRLDDRIAATADGTEVFLERTLYGEITGSPDLVGLPLSRS